MGRTIVLIIVFCIGIRAIFRPWVSIFGYYLYTIWGPQYIWGWHFQGVRVANFLAITAIIGVGLQCLKKHHYNFKFLLNRQSFFLLVLWLSVVASYYLGTYSGRFSYYDAHCARIFSLTNNIFLFYFVSALEINHVRKIRYIIFIFIFSAIFMTFWANLQYFTHNWSQFHMGRLKGPYSFTGALYKDENVFAMLFVSGLPFIFFWGQMVKKIIFKGIIWATIPLCCHAIFLTGSRGGLLGIGTIIISVLTLSKRKKLILPLGLLLFVFFQYQAGDTMKNRSGQITNIEGERSAGDRLVAWEGGGRMLWSNPITGVGLGMFEVVLPEYIEGRNMVAHNTLVQYSAESGVFAGLSYLAIIVTFFWQGRRIFLWSDLISGNEDVRTIHLFNNANLASFAGVVVCSLFLSLNTYEVFFVLVLLNNSLFQICSRNGP